MLGGFFLVGGCVAVMVAAVQRRQVLHKPDNTRTSCATSRCRRSRTMPGNGTHNMGGMDGNDGVSTKRPQRAMILKVALLGFVACGVVAIVSVYVDSRPQDALPAGGQSILGLAVADGRGATDADAGVGVLD